MVILPGVLGFILFGVAACQAPRSARPLISIIKTNYHGWSDSYILENRIVQAVVVPRIGRVMQFGFVGEEGVFWENRELDGKELSCESEQWINFGGDKTWPSPEAEWGRFTGRKNWHPPEAFDCRPLTAALDGSSAVVLTSPVDPHYGIRTVRRVSLSRDRPEMTIVTTYERVSGEPARIGIWVITQLKDPALVVLPLAERPEEIKDFVLLGKDRPTSLKLNGRVSMTRDPAAAHKVGFESSTLSWIGTNSALRIDSPRIRSAPYPDKGSSAEVYTNPDPLRYVELEMLSPLHELKPGDQISQTNRYVLSRHRLSESIRRN